MELSLNTINPLLALKAEILRGREREEEEEVVRGDVDVADFTAVGFVGLDVDPTVGVPEADGAVFAAAQAVVPVGVEPRR